MGNDVSLASLGNKKNLRETDRLREIVSQLTHRPAAEIELDAWPTHYGLDSLSLLIFREECERVFGLSIPDQDWGVMYKLADILAFVGRDMDDTSTSQGETISARSSAISGSIPYFSDSLIESVEIGMPLTGINHLSEYALLKYLGDLRWRHVSQLSGVPSRDLTDVSGTRLYPAFFYVETCFPLDRPMARYGENDVLQIIDSVKRFGFSMLDGTAYLISPGMHDAITRPLDDLSDAKSLGIPAVRMSNIFVMQFNGAEWLKKGRPRDGLLNRIREVPVAPDSHAIVKQAEAAGHIDLPGVDFLSLHDIPREYDYRIQPDRDVNGAGLLYFANYPLFLDLGEREALLRARNPWPDDLINKRTIISRKIAYLNNASWKDALRIQTQVWVKNPLSGRQRDLSLGPVQIFSNQLMYRVSDGRLMCVCSSHKLLYGVSAEHLQ